MSWWTEPRRVIQPILTVDDGNADIQEMVTQLADMGCDTILQNVGGMVAWYPTQVHYHNTPPGMKQDVLAEILETAHARGMRVLGRFDFSGLLEEAYQSHPSWFYEGPGGKPMIDKGYYATCLSGAYLDEYVLPIIHEVCSKYRLDGAFFNMFGYRTVDRSGVVHGPCQCSSCRKKYLEVMHTPLPSQLNDTAIGEDYRSFCDRAFLETLRLLDKEMKKGNPDFAMLIGHGSQSPYFLLEGIGETTEVELHWIPPNPKKIADQPCHGWRYMTGESCRQVRTMGDRFGSMINLYTCGGGRYTAHSAGFVGLGLAQTLANGGGPFIAFTGTPWAWDSKHRSAVEQFYGFMATHPDYFSQLRSTASIALITSGAELRSEIGQQNLLKEFRGLYSTMVRAHQDFDVVDTIQLEQADGEDLLSNYRLVILPNICNLRPEATARLREFVIAGGRLLVTGGTCLGTGVQSADSLGALLGVEKVEMLRPYVENAFFLDTDTLSSLQHTRALALNGSMLYLRSTMDCQKLLPMSGELEYASPELETIMPFNGQHGLILHKAGKGKTALLPWELGKLIYIYGQSDHIALFREMVEQMLEQLPLLVTDAPGQVEITLMRQPNGRFILQLVNESGQDGIEIGSPIVIRDINLKLRVDADYIVTSCFGEKQSLPTNRQNGYLCFTLPRLELYQLLTIEPEKK